jgi:hypothetical protein
MGCRGQEEACLRDAMGLSTPGPVIVTEQLASSLSSQEGGISLVNDSGFPSGRG